MSRPVGRSVRRPVAGLLIAVLLSVLLGLAGSLPAAAHAELLGTTPESGAVLADPPSEVVLEFSEPVGVVPDGLRLVTGESSQTVTGSAVGDTVVVMLPADLSGTQVLSWRVVSADSHPITGALVFSVGTETGTADVAVAATESAPGLDPGLQLVQVVAGAGHYLGVLTLAGLLLFTTTVAARLTSRGPAPALRLGLAAVASLGAGVAAAVTGVTVAGGGLADLLRPSSWLVPDPTLRTALLTVAGVWTAVALWLVADRRGSTGTGRGGSTLRLLAGVAAAAAVLSPVLSGHTQTMQPRALMLAADAVHLGAGAVWLGGLLGLGLLVRRVVTSSPGTPDALLLARATARFSTLAAVAVAALAASGVAMAVVVLPDAASLLWSGYGRSLLVKLSLVVVVLAVAYWNRTLLVPRITRRPDATAAWVSFRRSLRVEAALLTAVLLATGALVSLNPTDSRDGVPTEGDQVVVTGPGAQPVDPGTTGEDSHGDHADGEDHADEEEHAGEDHGGEGGHAHAHGDPDRTLTVRRDLADGELLGTINPVRVGANTFEFEIRDAAGELIEPAEAPRLALTLAHEGVGPLTATAEPGPDGGWTSQLDLPLQGEWTIDVTVRTDTFTESDASFAVIAV